MNPKSAAEKILDLLEGKAPDYEGNKALISVCKNAPIIAKRYLEAIELLNITTNSATRYELKFLDKEDEVRIAKFLAAHYGEE